MRDGKAAPFANLALELVRVTEVGAIAASQWIGKGDGKAADQASVDAIRAAFNAIEFDGEIVIGEGAKDEAAELYVGEKVGTGKGVAVDIAIDPLECTSSVAYGRPNAMSVIGIGPRGSLYHAADSYMQKLAVGRAAANVIDLDAPTKDTVHAVAKALGKEVGDITVAILDRPRHEGLISEVRAAGARVQLFTDGDIAMAIATCLRDSPIDIMMGVGGSAEAVISAAALRTLGGEILCRWKPKDEKHIARLNAAGVTDFSPILTAENLAKGDSISFIATGIITGPLMEGVTIIPEATTTHSMIMSTNPKTVRFIKTRHV
jgi:fructose-1,6-bisphosphatase II